MEKIASIADQYIVSILSPHLQGVPFQAVPAGSMSPANSHHEAMRGSTRTGKGSFI